MTRLSGLQAPAVTRVFLEPWRAQRGLLDVDDWRETSLGGSFIYYAQEVGAWGPIEVAFDGPQPKRETQILFTSNTNQAGQNSTIGLVIWPGMFVDLGRRVSKIWYRAHAARDSQISGASLLAGRSSPVLSAALTTASQGYIFNGWDSAAPMFWTGDNAVSILHAAGSEPEVLVAPGLVGRTVNGSPGGNSNYSPGQRMWACLSDDADSTSAFAHPRDVFPLALLQKYPRWEWTGTHSDVAAFNTGSAANQRLRAITVADQHGGLAGMARHPWGTTAANCAVYRFETTFALPYNSAGSPVANEFGWGLNSPAGRVANDTPTQSLQAALILTKGAAYRGGFPRPVRSAMYMPEGSATVMPVSSVFTACVPVTPSMRTTCYFRSTADGNAGTAGLWLVKGPCAGNSLLLGVGGTVGTTQSSAGTTWAPGASPQTFMIEGRGIAGMSITTDAALGISFVCAIESISEETQS